MHPISLNIRLFLSPRTRKLEVPRYANARLIKAARMLAEVATNVIEAHLSLVLLHTA